MVGQAKIVISSFTSEMKKQLSIRRFCQLKSLSQSELLVPSKSCVALFIKHGKSSNILSLCEKMLPMKLVIFATSPLPFPGLNQSHIFQKLILPFPPPFGILLPQFPGTKAPVPNLCQVRATQHKGQLGPSLGSAGLQECNQAFLPDKITSGNE